MKKSLLAIAALAAGFTMSAQQTVFFQDNFDEWLEPWAVAAGAGNSVGTNEIDTNAPDGKAPALTSIITEIDGKEVSCFDFCESKGYKFLYDKGDNKRIYLQKTYFKFGKTGNHAGVIIPPIDNVPAGTEAILSFDWCPMRTGAGNIDKVNLYVEVTNGDDVKKFTIAPSGWEKDHVLEWINATVKLEGVSVTKDTKIAISQEEWEVSSANRWFLDNIVVYAEATGIDAVVADENAPVEYFNLQGIRVNEPANGLYIRRQGNAVTKVMVK